MFSFGCRDLRLTHFSGESGHIFGEQSHQSPLSYISLCNGADEGTTLLALVTNAAGIIIVALLTSPPHFLVTLDSFD